MKVSKPFNLLFSLVLGIVLCIPQYASAQQATVILSVLALPSNVSVGDTALFTVIMFYEAPGTSPVQTVRFELPDGVEPFEFQAYNGVQGDCSFSNNVYICLMQAVRNNPAWFNVRVRVLHGPCPNPFMAVRASTQHNNLTIQDTDLISIYTDCTVFLPILPAGG